MVHVNEEDISKAQSIIDSIESERDAYRAVLRKLAEASEPYVLHGSADLYRAYHKALDLLEKK